MKPRKTSERIEDYEKVVICEEDRKAHNLPAKALGVWAIIKKGKKSIRLRKVRLDGYLMCDKYNNHQNLSVEAANAILKIPADTSIVIPKMGARKAKWIEDVIFVLTSKGIFPLKMSEEFRAKTIAQIFDDSNPERLGGKLYSSIGGAARVWRNRKAEENAFIKV